MRLYFKYFGMHLRSQMQYKTSFVLMMLGQFLASFSAFLGIYFMFRKFYAVDGFSFSEVLLCFAIVNLAFSLAECFLRGFDRFSSILSNGGFDRILVRPRGPIFQVIASQIELTRIGRTAQAMLVFAYAIPTCGVTWTIDKIFTLFLMIIGGFVVFSGLFILDAALRFFTTERMEFMNILTDGGREFARYPLSIYGEGFLKFFTFCVPMALFQYYPLLYLLGKTEHVLCMLAPLGCVLFLIPCLLLWRIGLRHYKSTGS